MKINSFNGVDFEEFRRAAKYLNMNNTRIRRIAAGFFGTNVASVRGGAGAGAAEMRR
ncbi:hypothetical protein [Primorskyibacter sedentarius]|uniref:hypothetical protein n=1 Tax=Primorskyibacter sedentarius TaxID=745311 RepID=UPI003EBC401C